jgi:hypothetical protein
VEQRAGFYALFCATCRTTPPSGPTGVTVSRSLCALLRDLLYNPSIGEVPERWGNKRVSMRSSARPVVRPAMEMEPNQVSGFYALFCATCCTTSDGNGTQPGFGFLCALLRDLLYDSTHREPVCAGIQVSMRSCARPAARPLPGFVTGDQRRWRPLCESSFQGSVTVPEIQSKRQHTSRWVCALGRTRDNVGNRKSRSARF